MPHTIRQTKSRRIIECADRPSEPLCMFSDGLFGIRRRCALSRPSENITHQANRNQTRFCRAERLFIMNITVLAVGTKMPRWVDEAVNEYAKRFGRDVCYTLKEIKPEKRGAGVNAAQGMAAEEKRILEAIPAGAFLVVLDERGKAPTSVELAGHLENWQRNGEHVCFVIGGADGMTDRLKQQARLMMRLSSLTLPHGMVRVLLTEQLYRAVSILHNHPYHRE